MHKKARKLYRSRGPGSSLNTLAPTALSTLEALHQRTCELRKASCNTHCVRSSACGYAWRPADFPRLQPARNSPLRFALRIAAGSPGKMVIFPGFIRKGTLTGREAGQHRQHQQLLCGVKDLTIAGGSVYNKGNGLKETNNGILAGFIMTNEGCTVEFNGITVSGGTIRIEGQCENGRPTGGMLGNANRVKAINCKVENIDISGVDNSGGFVGMDSGST